VRRLVVGSLVAAVCALGGAAHADRADQLFKKGKKLLAEKKYAEACTAFEESDRLDPGIGAKVNVARCYQEWGKLATAWRWFTEAEKMAKDTKDDRASKIHALAEELDPSIPRLTVKIDHDADTSGVVIKLDGMPFDLSALGTERRVDPGPHQVDYTVGGATRSKMVPIERGGSSEITIDLPKKSRGPAKPTVEPVAADGEAVRKRRFIGLGITGGGVLAMGIAGIVTLRARGDYNHAISAHCGGSTDTCDDVGLAATHSARRRANIATGITIGGLAAVAGGLVVYFTASRAAAHGEEHALYLAPSLGGDGTGVVLGGAF
jgi:hypothetical protein